MKVAHLRYGQPDHEIIRRSDHKISNIQNTINNVIVFVDEIDAYFIIDKKNMDFKFQNETDRIIEIKDIPPKSKVKRFMIGWN